MHDLPLPFHAYTRASPLSRSILALQVQRWEGTITTPITYTVLDEVHSNDFAKFTPILLRLSMRVQGCIAH